MIRTNHTASSCLNRNPNVKTAQNTTNLRVRIRALEKPASRNSDKKPAPVPRKPALFRILLIALDMRHNFYSDCV